MTGNADIRTLAELRAVLPEGPASDDTKVVTRIDDHCRRFIEASPFVVVASRNAAGEMDVSPKGDPAGFVRIVDEKTLAIPERPGNRRCDTFRNVIEVPAVALLFLVPGEDLTLRVMGQATVTTDAGLLASMAVGGRTPLAAMRVAVDQAFIHCGKAPKRAGLWDPTRQIAKGEFPRLGEMIHDQFRWEQGQDLPFSRDDLGDLTDADYEQNVY